MTLQFIFFAFIVFIAVTIGVVEIRNYFLYYKKTQCDICGEPTGFEGNKRFELANGSACQGCVIKAGKTRLDRLNQLGPRVFCMVTRDEILKDIAMREREDSESMEPNFTMQIDEDPGESLMESYTAPQLVFSMQSDENPAECLMQFQAELDQKFTRPIEENPMVPLLQVQETPQQVPQCPKCGCTSISADKKGFGIGKAIAGAAFAGPIGLAAGNIGAKKVRITCLQCGCQWMAGHGG